MNYSPNEQSVVGARNSDLQKQTMQKLADKVAAMRGKKKPIASIEPWLKNRGKVEENKRIVPRPGEKVIRMPKPKATKRYM